MRQIYRGGLWQRRVVAASCPSKIFASQTGYISLWWNPNSPASAWCTEETTHLQRSTDWTEQQEGVCDMWMQSWVAKGCRELMLKSGM